MLKNKYIKFLAFLGVIIICYIGIGKAIQKKSYAASSIEMLKLLEVEDELVENLHAYVKNLKRKFNLLDKYV